MKIGVIGTINGWSSETLANAVQEKTGFRLLIDMAKVRLDLEAGRLWFGDFDLFDLDVILIKKIGSCYSPDLLDRLEILRFIYERGMPVFSSPAHIMRVLDRLSCTMTLKLAGIPMPPTTITEDVYEAYQTILDYEEAVLKPLYSTKARGMVVLRKGAGLKDKINAYKATNNIIYIQKKIDLGGMDLGIVFLGGQYLTCYARCNSGSSWNTTTVSGGKYKAYKPSAELIDLAYKAQALFNLDFTCVDVVNTSRGPFVFEVSAFGGFRGIQETSNIDAAAAYVKYVMEKVRS